MASVGRLLPLFGAASLTPSDPLVGMVIAATGQKQKHFPPGCDLHRGGKDGRPGEKS